MLPSLLGCLLRQSLRLLPSLLSRLLLGQPFGLLPCLLCCLLLSQPIGLLPRLLCCLLLSQTFGLQPCLLRRLLLGQAFGLLPCLLRGLPLRHASRFLCLLPSLRFGETLPLQLRSDLGLPARLIVDPLLLGERTFALLRRFLPRQLFLPDARRGLGFSPLRLSLLPRDELLLLRLPPRFLIRQPLRALRLVTPLRESRLLLCLLPSHRRRGTLLLGGLSSGYGILTSLLFL